MALGCLPLLPGFLLPESPSAAIFLPTSEVWSMVVIDETNYSILPRRPLPRSSKTPHRSIQTSGLGDHASGLGDGIDRCGIGKYPSLMH